jgi:acetyltransferase-like isoleucine patch superfamily enzyme
MIHETADVSLDAVVDRSAFIWHLAQVREHASIGADSSVGRGAYIGVGVVIGASCKIQNAAMLYEPAVVEDGVFIGPGVIFTNDRFPRAVGRSGRRVSASEWEPVGVHVQEGASVGAGAVCVAPVTIGRWAFVAAGSIVTKDVRPFALVVGNPARQIAWVGHAGRRLVASATEPKVLVCPATGVRYALRSEDCLEEVQ